jgi:hypothetical protein
MPRRPGKIVCRGILTRRNLGPLPADEFFNSHKASHSLSHFTNASGFWVDCLGCWLQWNECNGGAATGGIPDALLCATGTMGSWRPVQPNLALEWKRSRLPIQRSVAYGDSGRNNRQ